MQAGLARVLERIETSIVAMLVAATFAVMTAGNASAQLRADAAWRTIESRHFRVTYEPGLEELARHAAASAERAHAALAVLVADAPRGMIDIVVADNVDLSNGYATPFPGNRVVVYVRPPVDVTELQYMRDWVELVVTHEVAHVFHLDVASPFGRAVRSLLGRVPAPWPVFPAVGVPSWNIEGLAIGIESAVTQFGRVHGSYNQMIVRTAALAGRFDEYDRLDASSSRWPGPARSYIYGSLFMDYLARQYGPDAAARIVGSTASAVIPPTLWFNRVGRNALGVSFRDAYREWEREVIERTDSLAALLHAQGITDGQSLTTHRAVATHPRFSRDGSRIAYVAYDWRSPPHVRVIAADDGRTLWSARLNLPAPAAWLDNDRLVVGDVDYVDQFSVLSDLHVLGDGSRRITRRARLSEPDVARDGRIVAIENSGGTNRIVLVEASTGAVRPVTGFDPATHYSLPRFSPGGGRIAASRWRNGEYDIVVIDTLGAVLSTVQTVGVNSAPAWSPDERWILFGSDRSGIPDIYAVAVADSADAVRTLRQVTSVLTGAFQPDVSPDGRWIIFSAYRPDGFRIERIPFDTLQWRSPAPPRLARDAALHGMHADHPGRALVDSAAVAVALADTTAGESRRYRAVRAMRPYYWSPVIDLTSDDTFLGATTSGQDLVGRHAWQAGLAFETETHRGQGILSYTFRGLPTIPGIGLHPSITAVVERDWSEFFRSADPANPFYIDEREDLAAIALGFTRPRWRTSTSLTVSGELVYRSRYLYDAPANARLIDPRDDLIGVRANGAVAHYVTPPLSISRENGYTLQLSARRRWDRDVRTVTVDDNPVLLDGTYTELTTWNTAYIALPLPGFARHVLALRVSGLARTGPGSTLTSIGGTGGTGFDFQGFASAIGRESPLLPVRGFGRGARAGTDAWTASAEYRFPIAFIDALRRGAFLDRISGAAFVDAGHAWCNFDLTSLASCTSTSATDAPLVGAGGEITIIASLLGIHLPVRTGIGVPLNHAGGHSPRLYLTTGPSF